MASNQVIIVFLRAPEPGQVKSRLAKHIGPEPALSLYRHFVQDTLQTVNALGIPVQICFYPAAKRDTVISWLGNGYTYLDQSGDHLGQRMATAFIRAFESGSDQAVLIGTDIPDLPGSIIAEAFSALNSHDAVIGPAADGGYYLIGFTAKGFLPTIFDGIPWGHPDVFARTLEIFNKHKRTLHPVPMWQDIDEYEDLLSYAQRNTGENMAPGNTATLIAQLIRNHQSSEW